MTGRVGVAIMAHPNRGAPARELRGRIGGGAQIVWDMGGPPTADPERRWGVGVNCWEAAAAQGREWSMVIQDDAVVCRDFLLGLEAALDVVPSGAVVSPYLGIARGASSKERIDEAVARANGASWAWTPFLHWGVAVVLPTAVVAEMIEFCSTPEWRNSNYDYRVARFVQDRMRQRVWCPFPSLVDHRDTDSLVGHGTNPDGRKYARRAHTYLGQRKSALKTDWTRLPEGGMPLALPPVGSQARPFRRGAALIR